MKCKCSKALPQTWTALNSSENASNLACKAALKSYECPFQDLFYKKDSFAQLKWKIWGTPDAESLNSSTVQVTIVHVSGVSQSSLANHLSIMNTFSLFASLSLRHMVWVSMMNLRCVQWCRTRCSTIIITIQLLKSVLFRRYCQKCAKSPGAMNIFQPDCA